MLEKKEEHPHMVKTHDIHLDKDYAMWIAELKHRYRSAQVKAAFKINVEKLLFNWQLGQAFEPPYSSISHQPEEPLQGCYRR